ncbi:MAG: gamma subclass chorismate mutase AroQ [Terrimicrobiaceae bacterium]|nr:gamma subclass chorismate mutase AroQ [Terrimicrobiaceae bacterium]
MRRASFLVSLLLFAARAALPATTPAEARVIDAIAARLALAGEVAWIKYLDGLPVRDPRREAEVLDQMTVLAASRGMNASLAREFFAAQIAASCAEQNKLVHLWKRGAPLPTYAPRSLRGGVRTDIDAANRALLDAIARLGPPPKGFQAQADRTLRNRGICREAARLATAPLDWRNPSDSRNSRNEIPPKRIAVASSARE